MTRIHLLMVCALLAVGLPAYGQCNPGNGLGGNGPDVIVGEIYGVSNYGAAGGYNAYSVGTRSCNIGTTNLEWFASTNKHPVIGQNLFRLKDGRFEQIGMSWLKHGFTALQFNACGCGCAPSGSGSLLGVGCSDPYGSSLNGSNGSLGARSEVGDPHSGTYTYPRVLSPFNADLTWRRLRVLTSDIVPAQNPGAEYWVEAMYITNDDALAGNAYNNASYRPVVFSAGGSMSYNGSTARQLPAIQAWQDSDPQVDIAEVFAPGETPHPGRLLIGSRVYDNGNGTFDYEYVVYNQNSSRGIQKVSIPVPGALTLTNVGFHDVDYHSNEVISGTDWSNAQLGASIEWETETHSTNVNANAIRWGSAYSYRFTANAGPTPGLMTLTMFRPHATAANTISVAVDVPSGTFIPGITNLTCDVTDNDVALNWTNGQLYTSVQVFRDGALQATLPGTQTFYDDFGLATGTYNYTVVGFDGGTGSGPAPCSVTILPVQPVTNLICSSGQGNVSLAWSNQGTYTSLEVRRSGLPIANLPGTQEFFTDTAVTPGSYVYRVFAINGPDTASPALCQMTVDPPLPTTFEVVADSKTVRYDRTTGAASFSANLSVFEDPGSLGYPNDVAGVSFAVANNDSMITPTAVNLAGSMQVLRNGLGPQFYVPYMYSDGVAAGIVFDLNYIEFLQASSPIPIMTVDYDTVPATLAGNTVGAATQLTFVDGLIGTSPVDNIVTTVAGVGIPPSFQHGVIDLEPLPEVLYQVVADSATVGYSDLSGAATFDIDITLVEDAGNTGYPNDVSGISVALVNDPSLIEPTAMTLSPALQALQLNTGPQFYVPYIQPNGIGAGIVFDLNFLEFLTAGTPGLEVMTVSYETNALNLSGNSAGATTQLVFTDGTIGTSPIDNLVTVDILALFPQFVHGQIDLVPGTGIFSRGDCNGDGSTNIADAVFLLGFLFPQGTANVLECLDACDGNDDESLNIADAVRILNALFGPTDPLPAPYPGCGADSGGPLDCANFIHCP
ncbi:MAG: dockerin type I repeat-containing protein [Planctomycetota bacterium]